jgi:cytochrome b involved in lipid metabolism
MKSKTILGIVVAIIILAGGIYLYAKPAAAPANPDLTPTATTTTPAIFTLTQVAAHNSATSCWTAISGGVYDLTSFINQHPGGSQAIMSLCGIDGTALFLQQHAGQRRPEQELASLKIGALSQ